MLSRILLNILTLGIGKLWFWWQMESEWILSFYDSKRSMNPAPTEPSFIKTIHKASVWKDKTARTVSLYSLSTAFRSVTSALRRPSPLACTAGHAAAATFTVIAALVASHSTAHEPFPYSHRLTLLALLQIRASVSSESAEGCSARSDFALPLFNRSKRFIWLLIFWLPHHL